MSVKIGKKIPQQDQSRGSDNWESVIQDAKDVGIRWERPKDNTKSAQDIINDSELLKNLGNQSGVKDMLKERVGDFENDADAAFRAVQVLEHIERFDGDGERLIDDNVGDGKVNGFTSSGDAKHDTEAGRLQDFGKYGFTNLKGELNHIDTASDDEEARNLADDLGIEWKRPDNDDRSAKDIIEDSDLLKNLGNQSGVKDMLKERVGDFEKDADAAYRAVQVLEHVELFDSDGKITTEKSGNGIIDGFTSSGDARHDTEAGRLQDFGKYGFESLKGTLSDIDSIGDDNELRNKAEELGIDWERPEGDDRSARDIIEDNPLLADLGEREKNQLKTRVGDFDKDANAAFRAVEVLNHIERYDENGRPIRGDKTIGNDKIDGFDRLEGGKADDGTEAGRFTSFIEKGFDALKRADASGSVDTERLEELADLMSDTIPDEDYEHLDEFVKEAIEGAHYTIIQDAKLPEDKSDILENPDKYTVEQRGAAILELSMMNERMFNGAEYWSDYGVVDANTEYKLRDSDGKMHTDPVEINKEISTAIDTLANEDVEEWLSKAEGEALQEMFSGNEKLEKFTKDLVTDMKDKGKLLDQAMNGKDAMDGMGDYYAMATTMNLAAGTDGKPLFEDLTIDIRDTKSFDKITKAYENNLVDETVMSKLVEGGMTEDEALAELNSRASLFASFGAPVDEIGDNVNRNIMHYMLSNTTQDDLKGVILNDDGSINEDRLKEVIQDLRETDPDSDFLKDDKGREMTDGQIVTAVRNLWDTLRGTLKMNHTLIKSGENFLSKNSDLAQAYGHGALHFVSSLLAGGSAAAKASDGIQSDAEMVGVIGGMMQMLGGFGEGTLLLGRNNLDTTRKIWNTIPKAELPATASAANEKIASVMDKLRVISATGGVFVMGASIATGIEESKKGNHAAAAAYIMGGISQAATAPFAYTQALSRMVGPALINGISNMMGPASMLNHIPPIEAQNLIKNAVNNVYTKAALGASRAMTIMNPLSLLAGVALMIYEGVQHDKKTEEYYDNFVPTLVDYGIDGGGENDPFYDEDHSSGLS